MLKLSYRGNDGNPCFVFGLSYRNIEVLKQGNPIVIDLAQLSHTVKGTVLLMAGETNETIKAELEMVFRTSLSEKKL